MKTLYLIRSRNDGGRGDSLAAQAVSSGLSFVSKYLHEEELPWTTIRATPCFVIDVDGTIQSIHEGSADITYDHAAMVVAFNAAPAALPFKSTVPIPKDKASRPHPFDKTSVGATNEQIMDALKIIFDKL